MGRDKAQNQKVKRERRARILSKALMLFATKGLAATKITDIAAAVGMSHGLFYHYYKSKEEIFNELIRTAFEKMNAAALELERLPVAPLEKIRIALEKLLLGIDKNEDTGRYYLLIAIAMVSDSTPEEAKMIIENQNMIPYEVITRIITAGQKQGTIHSDNAREMALAFWATIKGLAIHKAAHGEKFRMPSVDLLMKMFKGN